MVAVRLQPTEQAMKSRARRVATPELAAAVRKCVAMRRKPSGSGHLTPWAEATRLPSLAATRSGQAGKPALRVAVFDLARETLLFFAPSRLRCFP
jgi:hypothetical protein